MSAKQMVKPTISEQTKSCYDVISEIIEEDKVSSEVLLSLTKQYCEEILDSKKGVFEISLKRWAEKTHLKILKFQLSQT